MSYATLVGCTVVRNQTGSAVYYTPPIEREAMKTLFSAETTHFASGGAIVVTVEHKDLADTVWITAGTFPDITGTGVGTLVVSGVKEETRFKIGFSGGGPAEMAHVVFPEPTPVPE